MVADDADLVERGFDAEVRVQGHLASVWLPDDFLARGTAASNGPPETTPFFSS